MNENTWRIAACVVVGLQLLIPLAAGLPVMIGNYVDDEPRSDDTKKRRRLFKKARPIVAKREAARLAPLVCAKCRAPVPLLSAAFPCPFCGAPVAPPPDYVAALRDRAVATNELLRAEKLWRWSRVTSSPWLLWPVRIVDVVWSLLVGFCALALSGTSSHVPWLALTVAGVVAFFQVFVGLVWIQGFADMKKNLPSLPKRAALSCALENAACRGCGAPIQFAADRLAVVCNYCEADNYRAALAHEKRDEAAADKRHAGKSLLDAVRDVRTRRRESLLFVGFLAITEIFFSVVFVLIAIGNWIEAVLGL